MIHYSLRATTPPHHCPIGASLKRPNLIDPSYPHPGPSQRGNRHPPIRIGNPPRASPTSPIAAATALPRFGPSIPTICYDTNRPRTLTLTTTILTTHIASHSPRPSGSIDPISMPPPYPPFAGALQLTPSAPSAIVPHAIPSPPAPSSLASTPTRMSRSPIATSYTTFIRLSKRCTRERAKPPTQKRVELT